ncbi:hypothetical protein QYE76_048961 [Lolium multiflorum]|uniref:EF-hand domain-containing protein n=1 Tax=Lolium multiflorum TaxID=4521 RepID=A0AAD8SMX4_LOLMU|nr:hypothetical protein QYE76_048959 [Lolium multiflorum]KAK1660802.1 hypothetical protein QYE76_048961 [Lolium multiflorum]
MYVDDVVTFVRPTEVDLQACGLIVEDFGVASGLRISVAELSKVLGRIGEGCSTEECERMVASVDVDGDGCVGFEEFKKMMSTDAAGAQPQAGVPNGKTKKE